MTRFFLPLLMLLLIAAAVAPAQTCSGNQDFYGVYLYTAFNNRPVPAAAPSPSSALTFSETPTGRLLKNVYLQVPFASTGRLIADGLGGVFAAPPDADVITTRIGTYKVNSDCTLTMSLFDAFNARILPIGDPVPRGTAAFEGILQNRGDEANFLQTGQTWATSLSLARPFLAQGCTNAVLSGVFGIAGTGTATVAATESAPASAVPLSLLGRFVADGAGNLTPDTPALESPLPKRQITGTYKVEADCTGTARLIQDTRILNITFVLLRNGVRFGEFARATMRFAFADLNMAGLGTAR